MPVFKCENPNRHFKHSPFLPFEPDAASYAMTEAGNLVRFMTGEGLFVPYEYEYGWEKEMLSWHESCFIHGGLNPLATFNVKGPDALKMFSDISVNSLAKFEIGRAKHLIMCNEEGKIVTHGMCVRMAEDQFKTFALWPYLGFVLDSGNYDCVGTNQTGEAFFYQLGGPRSLEVIEAAAQKNLHHVRFLDWRDTTIAGCPVSIFRIGMAGTLAYEVHGATKDALTVYEALLEAGEEFDLRRLGRHAYRVIHTEAGFPQYNYHFPWAMRPGYGEFLGSIDISGLPNTPFRFTGSMDEDFDKHTHGPVECGWKHMVKFDHDFVGREAVQKEYDEPKRMVVTLEWDHEDVLDIFRSQFDRDNRVSNMEWVEDFSLFRGSTEYHDDKVMVGDVEVGISSGRMFSPFYCEMISLAWLDIPFTELGMTVEVLWGERGSRQKRIKARVARYPYYDTDRNENFDCSGIFCSYPAEK